MPEWSTISLFIGAASILVVIPGPNTIYIITRGLHQGLAAGIVSSLGVMVGTLFHITAAALGLSALLLSSALAFNIVKYAGAAYLVYLGIKTLLSREKSTVEAETTSDKSLTDTFYQGILVNTLNPKTALFFIAFLPQEVTADMVGAVIGAVGPARFRAGASRGGDVRPSSTDRGRCAT